MNVKGPAKDKTKVAVGAAKPWYLSYFAPKLNPDGTIELDAENRPILQRHRTYYATRADAEADKPRIETQHAATGTSEVILDRTATQDYVAARKITGEGIPLVDVAKFWRLHHPDSDEKKIAERVVEFIADRRSLLSNGHEPKRKRDLGRHLNDLESRCGAFAKSQFGARYPKTITKQEVISYLLGLRLAPNTVRNHKRCLCTFFTWLLDKGYITSNPAAKIKKSQLPKIPPRKEVIYLTLDQTRQYLRAAERYDPEIVAHEIVQLFSGVRADDEMDDFRAEFVHPRLKEIVLPADVAKTEKREVIDRDKVEAIFWKWWSEYGPKNGLLRPSNYGPRWNRIRMLASIEDRAQADELARLPIKTLLNRPEASAALHAWPFNARRRSFCSYHVAKHQSAEKRPAVRYCCPPWVCRGSLAVVAMEPEI